MNCTWCQEPTLEDDMCKCGVCIDCCQCEKEHCSHCGRYECSCRHCEECGLNWPEDESCFECDKCEECCTCRSDEEDDDDE